MAFVECSASFCTATFWESKYKALRGAFVAWRGIERQRRKYHQKNLQRLTVWVHEVHQGKAESIWKIKNLLFEMRAEADD
jgi:hypothetical protein